MEKESNIGKFSGALRADQLLENYLQGRHQTGEEGHLFERSLAPHVCVSISNL